MGVVVSRKARLSVCFIKDIALLLVRGPLGSYRGASELRWGFYKNWIIPILLKFEYKIQ